MLSNIIRVRLKGRIWTLAELARAHGLRKDTVYLRYKRGLRGLELIRGGKEID